MDQSLMEDLSEILIIISIHVIIHYLIIIASYNLFVNLSYPFIVESKESYYLLEDGSNLKISSIFLSQHYEYKSLMKMLIS